MELTQDNNPIVLEPSANFHLESEATQAIDTLPPAANSVHESATDDDQDRHPFVEESNNQFQTISNANLSIVLLEENLSTSAATEPKPNQPVTSSVQEPPIASDTKFPIVLTSRDEILSSDSDFGSAGPSTDFFSPDMTQIDPLLGSFPTPFPETTSSQKDLHFYVTRDLSEGSDSAITHNTNNNTTTTTTTTTTKNVVLTVNSSSRPSSQRLSASYVAAHATVPEDGSIEISPTGRPQRDMTSRKLSSTSIGNQDTTDNSGSPSVSSSQGQTNQTPARSLSVTQLQVPISNGQKVSKKNWYSVLTPTYKTRSEEFVKHFKIGLQQDEKLIVDYSCALQKDILVHGRLYISQNRVCFHAKIMGWVTHLTIPCKDITAMTKEKTARVIPNAIQICVSTPGSGSGSSGSTSYVKNDKYFFTSFSTRDKTYLMLFRVWQNALLDQPMSMQELWQWVHFCYGEELGLTVEDSDYVPGNGSMRKLVSSSSVCEGQSMASSLSESVTDEDKKKRTSFFYSPPVEKAVEAMDHHNSGLSTSEMEGGVSEDGDNVVRPKTKFYSEDVGVPERPPRRKPRAGTGTVSNSDTDEKPASGKALFVMSEPEISRRDSGSDTLLQKMRNRVSSGASGAGSPHKKRPAPQPGEPASKPKPALADLKLVEKLDVVSKPRPNRASPQHVSRGRSVDAHVNGHGTTMEIGDSSGEDAEANDDSNRLESFCPCTSHLPIQALNKELNMSVDQVYSLLFTECQWNKEFVASSKRTDYSSTSWTMSDANGDSASLGATAPSPAAVAMSGGNRKRMLKYVVHLKPTLGPKTCNATETQTVHGYSVPGDIYVIDANVKNSGIPYGDNFYISNR